MSTIRLSRSAMNCEFELILCGESEQHLQEVGGLVIEEIKRLDRQLSYFNPASDVSFLNEEAWQRPVPVEPGLFGLLQTAMEVSRETNGAFDITAAPLIDLWREAERSGREPDQGAIGEVLPHVGMRHIVLDDACNTVRFGSPGVRINLGAVGKGYAVDCVVSILREYDIHSALVSAGRSTICAMGDQPDGDGWSVGIRHPSRLDEHITVVDLHDEALSTSGGVMQMDEAVEERFEHIIDPRTGLSALPSAASASVIAPNGTVADALSTAFYLSGELAAGYCQAHEGFEAIFVEQKEEGCGFSVVRVP